MSAGHHCPTGYHEDPSYVCYVTHQCRCDGCREDAARYRAERRRSETITSRSVRRPPNRDEVAVPVPGRVFTLAVDAAQRAGMYPGPWIADAIRRQADRERRAS